MSLFIRHGKPFAAFSPAGSQYPATILSGHAAFETVLILSFPNRGLKCPFHYSKYFSVRIQMPDNWRFFLFLKRFLPRFIFRTAKIDKFFFLPNGFSEKND